jgi:hypothetical protein
MQPDGPGEWRCWVCARRLYDLEGTITGAREAPEGELLKPTEVVAWIRSQLARGSSMRDLHNMTGRSYAATWYYHRWKKAKAKAEADAAD